MDVSESGEVTWRCGKYDEFLGNAGDRTAESISNSPEFTAGTTIEPMKIVLTSYGTIRRCPVTYQIAKIEPTTSADRA
jgi:hypothetical protein